MLLLVVILMGCKTKKSIVKESTYNVLDSATTSLVVDSSRTLTVDTSKHWIAIDNMTEILFGTDSAGNSIGVIINNQDGTMTYSGVKSARTQGKRKEVLQNGVATESHSASSQDSATRVQSESQTKKKDVEKVTTKPMTSNLFVVIGGIVVCFLGIIFFIRSGLGKDWKPG